MKIAVIPARGGSRRIERKNIRPFCGRPMIAWSIDAARESGIFDRIIVSTDDREIAGIAAEHGAEVPFLRPAALADDYTGTVAVIAHALGALQREHGDEERQPCAEFVCCLYATAPFVRPADLRSGLDMLMQRGADFCIPVTTFPFPIQRAVRMQQDGRLHMFMPEHETSRSQDLEEAFHDAGQFYWGTHAAWTQRRSLFGDRSIGLRLPRYRVQDIDTPEDWEAAEQLFRAQLRL